MNTKQVDLKNEWKADRLKKKITSIIILHVNGLYTSIKMNISV